MGLGERRGPGAKMSRTESGAHTHRTHPHRGALACLDIQLCVHLSWQAPRLANMQDAHSYLPAHKITVAHTFVQAHLACKHSLHTEALHAFAFRRVPWSWVGEGVEEPSIRSSFRVSPLPQRSLFHTSQYRQECQE